MVVDIHASWTIKLFTVSYAICAYNVNFRTAFDKTREMREIFQLVVQVHVPSVILPPLCSHTDTLFIFI